jgi:hypothetical protein
VLGSIFASSFENNYLKTYNYKEKGLVRGNLDESILFYKQSL